MPSYSMGTQTDEFLLLLLLLNNQGFINKSSYKSYDTHSSIQILDPTETIQKCLWISIKTSEISLIQQMSQQIQISSDMQRSKC